MNQHDLLYSGKAKSAYKTDIPDQIILTFRDDITAFDGGKKDRLSLKGSYNAQVSARFFEYLESRGVLTHFIRMIDDHTMVVRALDMIPLEVIVRNIAAGSMVKKYPVEEGTPLNPPVIVIDYKDDSLHDPMLNDDLIIILGILTREELTRVKDIAIEINDLLKDYLLKRDIILVDFKLEFGKQEGRIILGDEISMDSMRLWDRATGRSLDKDVYRFNRGDVVSTYRQVAERILSEERREE